MTDHRMILSISKEQTTLYDQIQYTGSPESFAWVLPIAGTVEVGLSADTVFAALQNLTGTVVQEPPRNCPPPPRCESDDRFAGASATDAGAPSPAGGVDVLKKEVVGPYETVQLRSTDPNALNTWLAQNGFNIPADVQPVIGAYVAEKFDFLALKLAPGQGVQSMRPVRVTTQGASAVLPLRMVAAGTGPVVGISLWVVGEGRYEPQNFQSFMITNDDLVWDWATGTSNYKELRAARAAALAGRGWELESSIQLNRWQFENVVRGVGFQGATDYAPVEENGSVVKTSDQVREEDLTTMFAGIAQGQERVTRLRSDLSRAALDADLAMIASADQALVSNVRVPKQESGQPLCPVYRGCDQVGTAPRDQAQAITDANNERDESFSCSTAASGEGTSGVVGLGGLSAFAALAFVRARRERRARG